MKRRSAWCLAGLVAAVAAASLAGGTALAGKPSGGGGGGGGGGDTGGGTIYFRDTSYWPWVVYAMNSDGSGRTAQSVQSPGVWEPSRALHGGHRWWIANLDVSGATYPNQTARHELVAVRGDSNSAFTVQLTNDPALQYTGGTRWLAGDGRIAFVARHWDSTTGMVDGGGLYVLDLSFDTSGNLVQPSASPLRVASVPMTTATYPSPDVNSFDVTSDGTLLVYANAARSELRTVDLATGTSRLLTSMARCLKPEWSPDMSEVAFEAYNGSRFQICTIGADGSGLEAVVSERNRWVGTPKWSPTGSHLAYEHDKEMGTFDAVLGFPYIYRIRADGTDAVNLTRDLGYSSFLFAWR